MKNRKRLLALLLSLALTASLCACGLTGKVTSDGPGESASAGPSIEASPDPDASPSIEADLSQDIVAFASGLSADDVLLTVSGDEVKADLVLYLLAMNCDFFLSSYYAMMGYQLTDAAGDGATFADQARDSAVYTAAYYMLLRQQAAQLGCPPTEAQVQETRDLIMANGQENYDRLKALFGLTDESMEFLYLSDVYYENVLNAMVPTVTDEMLNGYAYQVKHILLKTVDDRNQPLSDDEIAAQKALSEDILAQLQAVEGEERLALFDELMNQYSEDGRDENGDLYAPDGYTAVPGDMVPEFEEASLALPIGGMSGIVESSYGYHIILRGEMTDLESYAEDCRVYQVDKELDALIEKAEVTRAPALDTLDVAEFFERYAAYQDAIYAQQAEG